MAPVYGFTSKLGIGTASLTLGTRLDFVSDGLKMVEDQIDTGGIRGTRSHSDERLRLGLQRCVGDIVLRPTAVELAAVMAWILGGTPSGTSYTLAETLPEKYVFAQRGDGTNGKVFEYLGAKVNRAVFRASRGAAMELVLSLVARTETITSAGTFPSGSIDVTTGPFVFTDLAVTVAATTYKIFDFELSIDNRLDADAFLNSVTIPREIQPTDRTVEISIPVPYGDNEALYNLSGALAAVTATFTNGTVSVLFTLPAVRFIRETPTVPQREQEIQLPLRGMARKTGSTAELTVTLDSTP